MGLVHYTDDPSTLDDQYLDDIRRRHESGEKIHSQEYQYLDEAYKRTLSNKGISFDGNYVINPQHVPNSGEYKSNKSVLPENHQELWKGKSYKDSEGNWWSVEGKGKKAIFHRFQEDNNGNYHWNGSTNGKTKSGDSYPININNVPNELKKKVEYN